MKHLANLIAGVGSVMGAFGGFRPYDRPQPGDRARDLRKIGNDFRAPGKRLKNQTEKAKMRSYGSINYGATAR